MYDKKLYSVEQEFTVKFYHHIADLHQAKPGANMYLLVLKKNLVFVKLESCIGVNKKVFCN